MKSYHLTQEQARKIAIEQGFVVSREDSPLMLEMLHAYANAVLDQVLGEPFGIWHVGDTEDESDFYLYEDAGDVSCDKCIKLYAPKGQP